MSAPMLSVQGLRVSVGGREVLRGIDLTIGTGEVHALMGPNGSGKSTFAHALAGRDGLEIPAGRATFFGEDLLALPAEERALRGMFLGFQYPLEIPGVSNIYFLKAAVNAKRRHEGLPELDAVEFMKLARAKMEIVGLPEGLAQRGVNEGFSGGEKKRNEIFQMLVIEPRLAILDETDSGLDVDALRVVTAGINQARSPERSFLLITHYERMLDLVAPDFVHVILDGRVVRSGGSDLAQEIAARGFGFLEDEQAGKGGS